MPVNVPEEPKNYTTIYDNFKGVDFTNDASNVYKRRSPTGINMLPDLDGRPHKRTGWEISASVQDFIEASGATGVETVEPGRTYHFSYGGFDYLMIFNSVGVFWVQEGDDTVHLAELANGTEGSYTTSAFPPEGKSADHNRAFFFEGNGLAGFYVFVENTLYRFGAADDGELLFWKVEPTVPVLMIGASPGTGVGTINQAINMLTDRRTIQYFGDGTSVEYFLPTTPDSEDNVEVELLNNKGEWEPTTAWSLTDNKVTFNVAPAASTVDNVKITYSPSEKTAYALETDTATSKKSITTTHTIVETQKRRKYQPQVYKNKKWVNNGKAKYIQLSKWSKTSDTRVYGSANIPTPSLYNQKSFVLKTDYASPGTFVDISAYSASWRAYNGSVDIAIKNNDIADKYGSTKVTTSGWAKSGSPADRARDNLDTALSLPDWHGVRVLHTTEVQTRTTTKTKTYNVYGTYTKIVAQGGAVLNTDARNAFMECRKVLTFGNDIYNQVFLSASTKRNYRNRVWYSAANDPAYFPDTNYIEAGADDKSVMGLIKVGSYLGIVKMGSGTEASVYLAYPTSFEQESTYAVKQSVSGIGAISTGAFNILNEEPLFLSERGVMGININESDNNKWIRNRSYYINGRLAQEENVTEAISYVFDGLYYLAINGHCYVLDGSQKTSWANEKTNLQYECYYLDNIPAQCFSSMGGLLYFTDYKGNLCRFKKKTDGMAYIDGYLVEEADWIAATAPVNGEFNVHDLGGASDDYGYLIDDNDDYLCVYPPGTTEYSEEATYEVGEYVLYDGSIYVCTEDILTPEEWNAAHWEEELPDRLMVMVGEADVNATISYFDDFYTITEIREDEDTGEKWAIVSEGVPIFAEWSTIADDDEMVHFFKNLRKKGCVVSLLPGEGSYIQILIKPDEKEPVNLGYIEAGVTELPSDLIVKKKIKKYKRLQFIIRDDWYNDGFALDQIIKTYTVGNYSKNRK